MHLILTGSLGHISQPLAQRLLQQGHSVTIVSSDPARRSAIEALGARAAIGSVEDAAFLADTFRGADAAYCMTPPRFAAPDQLAYYVSVAEAYAAAVRASGIGRIVYLSSYGAHLPSGTGFITGSHRAEQLLNALPDVRVTHLRPGFFYYNLFGFIPGIKAMGFIGAVYGGTDRLALVAPADIAAAAAEELVAADTKPFRYIASDDRSCNEIAAVLGRAIGNPGLEWRILPREAVLAALGAAGVPASAASNLVELGEAIHSGRLREDFDRHPPELGSVKLEAFAEEFAGAYQA